MNYTPKYFKPYELVSPAFYKKWGDKSLWFIDAGLLFDLDVIREAIGSLTVNDWKWGGNYKASGLRAEGDAYYNPTSAHSFGKAVDLKSSHMNSEELRSLIIDLKKQGKIKFISRMELQTNGWVHVDCFNAAPNHSCGLYLFNP